MSNTVRAWKDATYRQSLSAEEQAVLPANPAGEIELNDTELDAIFGADGGHGGHGGGAYQGSEETTGAAKSSSTTSQNGGLNIAIPNVNGLIPALLGIPIGTQQNPTQCASSASANPRG